MNGQVHRLTWTLPSGPQYSLSLSVYRGEDLEALRHLQAALTNDGVESRIEREAEAWEPLP